MALPSHSVSPWSAPDTAAADATSAPDASAPGGTNGVTTAEPIVPRPVPLRPLTASDVLDGAIAIIKGAPKTILGIAAAIVVPLELLTAWLQRDTLGDSGISGVLNAASSTSSPLADITAATIALFVLAGIVLSLMAGAIAYLMSAWYADRNPGPRDALRASVSRLPALAVAWFAVHVIEAAGLIGFAVGALLLMPLFMVTAPAIVVERLGPWRGVRRSMRLTRSRYGAVLGIAILVGIVDGLLTLALTGVGLLFSFFDWGWIVNAVCTAGSSLITVPFVAGTATLMYFDLRVRSEGLDLELGIATHFAGAH